MNEIELGVHVFSGKLDLKMASRKEIERLEDENRTVCQRLADVEVELTRKEEALKAANQK